MTAATTVHVRYFASAKAAVGLSGETITLSGDFTVQDVLSAIGTAHGERLAHVLASASFLLDGMAIRDLLTLVAAKPGTDAVELDVLPPFAGG